MLLFVVLLILFFLFLGAGVTYHLLWIGAAVLFVAVIVRLALNRGS